MGGAGQTTLETRLQAFIDHIDSSVSRTDEGGVGINPIDGMIRSVGGNFIFRKQYLVPEQVGYHRLSLTTLRHLARYLSDAIVRPSAAIATTLDHLNYWGWTAAVAGSAMREENERFEIGDLQYTVHLGLLPVRVPSFNGNPTMDAISSDNERLMLLSSLAVLEGLICNLGDSLTKEARTRRTITASWKPTDQTDSFRKFGDGAEVHNYHDILQIWRTCDARPETERILSEINDLTRYDEETLRWKFSDSADIIEEEFEDGTENFLRIVGKHRDFNLHGQRSTRTLAPLVLTLCCLFIWDTIDEQTYAKSSERAINGIQFRSQSGSVGMHPLWPSSLYPP